MTDIGNIGIGIDPGLHNGIAVVEDHGDNAELLRWELAEFKWDDETGMEIERVVSWPDTRRSAITPDMVDFPAFVAIPETDRLFKGHTPRSLVITAFMTGRMYLAVAMMGCIPYLVGENYWRHMLCRMPGTRGRRVPGARKSKEGELLYDEVWIAFWRWFGPENPTTGAKYYGIEYQEKNGLPHGRPKDEHVRDAAMVALAGLRRERLKELGKKVKDNLSDVEEVI